MDKVIFDPDLNLGYTQTGDGSVYIKSDNPIKSIKFSGNARILLSSLKLKDGSGNIINQSDIVFDASSSNSSNGGTAVSNSSNYWISDVGDSTPNISFNLNLPREVSEISFIYILGTEDIVSSITTTGLLLELFDKDNNAVFKRFVSTVDRTVGKIVAISRIVPVQPIILSALVGSDPLTVNPDISFYWNKLDKSNPDNAPTKGVWQSGDIYSISDIVSYSDNWYECIYEMSADKIFQSGIVGNGITGGHPDLNRVSLGNLIVTYHDIGETSESVDKVVGELIIDRTNGAGFVKLPDGSMIRVNRDAWIDLYKTDLLSVWTDKIDASLSINKQSIDSVKTLCGDMVDNVKTTQTTNSDNIKHFNSTIYGILTHLIQQYETNYESLSSAISNYEISKSKELYGYGDAGGASKLETLLNKLHDDIVFTLSTINTEMHTMWNDLADSNTRINTQISTELTGSEEYISNTFKDAYNGIITQTGVATDNVFGAIEHQLLVIKNRFYNLDMIQNEDMYSDILDRINNTSVNQNEEWVESQQADIMHAIENVRSADTLLLTTYDDIVQTALNDFKNLNITKKVVRYIQNKENNSAYTKSADDTRVYSVDVYNLNDAMNQNLNRVLGCSSKGRYTYM